MKRYANCLLIGMLGLGLGMSSSRANLEVSASVQINAVADFYAPLTPHGVWVEVGTYGRCWRPAHVAVGWRPYCIGHWVWTDCGWYWYSDEPWAWACYHYGWWVHDSDFGWVWVPGVEWGPAWVSWRFGGGYCGWAPLPPRGIAPPRLFVFVEAGRFRDPVRPSSVIVNNTTIINKTTVIGGVRHETRNVGGSTVQNVVVNEGPAAGAIQKATREQFAAVPIREAAARTPVPSEAVRKINESRKNNNPSATPGSPAAPTPPDQPKDGGNVGSSPPQQPPGPNPPQKQPQKPGKGKHKGDGRGQGSTPRG